MKAAPAVPDAPAGAAFPWNEAMSAALGLLRLSPREFWAMTPRELSFALAPFAARAPAPLERGGLDALMRRFPDP